MDFSRVGVSCRVHESSGTMSTLHRILGLAKPTVESTTDNRDLLTERDWLTCADSISMLRFLQGKISERKSRLFDCAACRRVWHTLDEESRRAVDVWDRHAEGLATTDEVGKAIVGWCDPGDLAWSAAIEGDEAAQAVLLREIVGNPFRPVPLDPSWLTSTVQNLAAAIYEERAFDRLPILADALEDAGCANQDLLHHCRQAGEHVRGCWAVDILLDK